MTFQLQKTGGKPGGECYYVFHVGGSVQQLRGGSVGGPFCHFDSDLCTQLLPHERQLADVSVQYVAVYCQVGIDTENQNSSYGVKRFYSHQ